MTFHQYLSNAVQDDAQRAGARDRMLLQARQARLPRRPRPVPGAPAQRLARLQHRRATA
jgi:hypothetical protein